MIGILCLYFILNAILYVGNIKKSHYNGILNIFDNYKNNSIYNMVMNLDRYLMKLEKKY